MDLPYAPVLQEGSERCLLPSYGPGRYDPIYEEKGTDYPAGYVKWTERRNMAASSIWWRRSALTSAVIKDPIRLRRRLKFIPNCGKAGWPGDSVRVSAARELVDSTGNDQVRPASVSPKTRIVLGCIGAGNYANTKLLRFCNAVRRCAFTRGHRRRLSAASAARRFPSSAPAARQRYLRLSEVNAVLIATPHGSHAGLIGRALRSGKAVFAENRWPSRQSS